MKERQTGRETEREREILDTSFPQPGATIYRFNYNILFNRMCKNSNRDIIQTIFFQL